MIVGITRETVANETRVAATPETVAKMLQAGLQVLVEKNAGEKSFYSNQAYTAAGASVVDHVLDRADILFKVLPPTVEEARQMKNRAIYMGPLYPQQHEDVLKVFLEKNITSFALELLPRIARAQSMDILSSMSNLAGYKSVILAADHLNKIFPMLTTAAGTILPAKVIVIGVGVAGLQAIATARRLGAVVLGFDTRPVTEEQVKSLGAEFVSLATTHEAQDAGGYAKEQSKEFYKQEQDIIGKYASNADVIISTALVPGKGAPLLITQEMVAQMPAGAVIVDLSAAQGGNCELTEAGKIVVKHNVTIIGLTDLPSLVPSNASLVYAKNLWAFLSYCLKQIAANKYDSSDEIIKGTLITHQGQNERVPVGG
jgi:NAD(P) transhydrogenase subunit alpha